MSLLFGQLHPYQSLLLARRRSGKNTKGFVQEVLRDIERVIDFSKPGRTIKTVWQRPKLTAF